MLGLKRLVIWCCLILTCITQILLYIPTFTCTANDNLPICTPQFQFSLVDDSPLGQELISSAREFLKLLSYLTIDMGWTPNHIIKFKETYGSTKNIYDDENLVDTFYQGNYFKVNYQGYCKYNKNKFKYITRKQCYSNENNGMDILTVLMRDIGVQLGELSYLQNNESIKLGNSVVYTYKLATQSLFDFIYNDEKEDNMFARVILGNNNKTNTYDNGEASPKRNSNFEKVIIIARVFTLFNEGIRIILIVEMSFSLVCFVISLLSFLPLIKPISYKFIILAFLTTLMYILLATATFLNSVILQVILKSLSPMIDEMDNIIVHSNQEDWGLIRVSVGTGFILGCLRYVIQLGFFSLTIALMFCHRKQSKAPSSSPKQSPDPPQSPKDAESKAEAPTRPVIHETLPPGYYPPMHNHRYSHHHDHNYHNDYDCDPYNTTDLQDCWHDRW